MALVLEETRPGLAGLVAGVRAAVDRRAGWRETAALVGSYSAPSTAAAPV